MTKSTSYFEKNIVGKIVLSNWVVLILRLISYNILYLQYIEM